MSFDISKLPESQQTVLKRWLSSLETIPEVDLIWLEGSLVDPARANPGSDIDLRVAVADDAYDRLWESTREPLTAGIGEHLVLLDLGFIRALTKAEGIVAELDELTPKLVWRETEMTLANIANAPGPFYMGEWQSIHFIIAETRSSIVRIMYRLTGLAFAKRFKHLSQVLPAAYLADLDQLLSDKADGGFEPKWYWRLLEQTRARFNEFLIA